MGHRATASRRAGRVRQCLHRIPERRHCSHPQRPSDSYGDLQHHGRGQGVPAERTIVQSNGEPNCQGRPAQYVIDHFLRKAYLEVGDDTLKTFATPDAPSPLFVYVRLR